METQAYDAQSDRSWTEKVCAMAAARDGSLQVGFGVGKYTNRGVFDGYASCPAGGTSGRCAPAAACRTRRMTSPSGRATTPGRAVVTGSMPAAGWVEVDGVRTEITTDGWFTTRDHSWGVRHDVGQPLTDVEPSYGLGPGVAFRFDSDNRRVLGGTLHFTMADGSARPVTVDALGDTGVHLGLGLYFGVDGRHHGEWRGALHVAGGHIPECTDLAVAPRIHQIRDAVMRVTDPVGRGSGWCNLQTIIVGAWPELGLDEESSFV